MNKPAYINLDGPLLLAANHPNSFLDGMILTTLFEKNIYSLARGDAFKNKNANRFLRWLRLLPVYRTSEGVENLEHNYTTFAACLEVFRKKGIVLIFSEGRCENEWHLRPLRKGTARLAHTAWEDGIPLKILPVGFNYSSFKKFGKEVHINFGSIFSDAVSEDHFTHGKQLSSFNHELHRQLKELVYEIKENDIATQKKHFSYQPSIARRMLSFIPSIIAILAHAPLYAAATAFTNLRYRESGHYDSVQTSVLMISYPIYLAAIAVLLHQADISALWVFVLPVCLWIYARAGFRI